MWPGLSRSCFCFSCVLASALAFCFASLQFLDYMFHSGVSQMRKRTLCIRMKDEFWRVKLKLV